MSRAPQATNGGGSESIPPRAGFEETRNGGGEDAAGPSRTRAAGKSRDVEGQSGSEGE
jgi:hypothetical protein